MKAQEKFKNTLQPKRYPPVRLPPKVPAGNSEILPDGKATMDLMPLLEDGQIMLAGRIETMTRQKLIRTWPRKAKIGT